MQKIAAAREKIEEQCMAIEGATTSLEAMRAMQVGASAMRVIHQNMSVEKVDQTMDDIREQMEIANEINDAISQPLGGEQIDEDDLTRELEELEEQSMGEQLMDLPSATAAVPAAATAAPAATAPAAKAKPKKTEEDELAALEAAMTM